MKKERAEELTNRHREHFARKHQTLHVIPRLHGKPDDHCILCSSYGEPIGVWSSDDQFTSHVTYDKKVAKERGWF